MELQSILTSCIVHLKDGNKVGVTFPPNGGHEERYPLNEPMNRKETEEFYETDNVKL